MTSEEEEEDHKFSIIKPGSAEWQSALVDIKTLEDAGQYEGSVGAAVAVNVLQLKSTAGRRYLAHHGTQTLGDFSKVFVHFKGIVTADYEELGAHLLMLTSRTLNIPRTQAEAGPSPVFRHQFDYVLLGIPNLRRTEVYRRIIESLAKTFI